MVDAEVGAVADSAAVQLADVGAEEEEVAAAVVVMVAELEAAMDRAQETVASRP